MTQSHTLKRVTWALFALALLFALPGLAGTAPQPQAALAGCHLDVSFLGELAPQSPAAEAALPAWLDLAPQTTQIRVFRGFSRCSCNRTPNCNTSADCGGSACLGGITCC